MTVGSAEHDENFFSMSVHPEQRKEMRLVKNPAADREDVFYMPTDYVLTLEAEQVEQRSVNRVHGSVIREADETAWDSIDQFRNDVSFERYSRIASIVSAG